MEFAGLRLNTSALFRCADYISPVILQLDEPGFALSHSAVPVRILPTPGRSLPRPEVAGVAPDGSVIVADVTRVVGDETDNGNPWFELKRLPELLDNIRTTKHLGSLGLMKLFPDGPPSTPAPVSAAANPLITMLLNEMQLGRSSFNPHVALANRRAAIMRDFLPMLGHHVRKWQKDAPSDNPFQAPSRRLNAWSYPTFVSAGPVDGNLARVAPRVRSGCQFVDADRCANILGQMATAAEQAQVAVASARWDAVAQLGVYITCCVLRLVRGVISTNSLGCVGVGAGGCPLLPLLHGTSCIFGFPAIECTTDPPVWFSEAGGSTAEAQWKCELVPACTLSNVLIVPESGHRSSEYLVHLLKRSEDGQTGVLETITCVDDGGEILVATVSKASSRVPCIGLRIVMRGWSPWNHVARPSGQSSLHHRSYGIAAIVPISPSTGCVDAVDSCRSSFHKSGNLLLRTVELLAGVVETQPQDKQAGAALQQVLAPYLQLWVCSGSGNMLLRLLSKLQAFPAVLQSPVTEKLLCGVFASIQQRAVTEYSQSELVHPIRQLSVASTVIPAVFDAELSSGVSFGPAYLSVTSTSKSACALLKTACENKSGTYRWDLKLSEDRHGQECACFGLVAPPMPDPAAYEQSACAFVVRAYNGKLYLGGQNKLDRKKMSKIHPGSIVTCWYDTFTSMLGFSINGNWQGAVLIDTSGAPGPLFPAVILYATNKVVHCIGDLQLFPYSLLQPEQGLESTALSAFPLNCAAPMQREPCLANISHYFHQLPMMHAALASQSPHEFSGGTSAVWSCQVCTCDNSSQLTQCQACGTARAPPKEIASPCAICTFENPLTAATCSMCQSPLAPSSATDGGDDALLSQCHWEGEAGTQTLFEALLNVLRTTSSISSAYMRCIDTEMQIRRICCKHAGVAGPDESSNHYADLTRASIAVAPASTSSSANAWQFDAWAPASVIPCGIVNPDCLVEVLGLLEYCCNLSTSQSGRFTEHMVTILHACLKMMSTARRHHKDLLYVTGRPGAGDTHPLDRVVSASPACVGAHMWKILVRMFSDPTLSAACRNTVLDCCMLLLPFLCMTVAAMQQAVVACVAHASKELSSSADPSVRRFLQALQLACGCFRHLIGFSSSDGSLRVSWSVLTDMSVLHECGRFLRMLATLVVTIGKDDSNVVADQSRHAMILAYRVIWVAAAAQVASADASQLSSDPVIFHAFDVLESLATTPYVIRLIAPETSKFLAAIQSVSVSSSEFTCSVVGRIIGLLASLLSTGVFDSSHVEEQAGGYGLVQALSCGTVTDKDLLALRLADLAKLLHAPMQRPAQDSGVTACWYSAVAIVRSFARQLLSCSHIPVGNEEEFLTPWLQNGIMQLPLLDFEQPMLSTLKEQRQRWSKWTGTSKSNIAVAQRLASTRLQAQATNVDIDNSLQAILLSFAPESTGVPRDDTCVLYAAGSEFVASLLEFSVVDTEFVTGDAGSRLVAWLSSHAKVNFALRSATGFMPVEIAFLAALLHHTGLWAEACLVLRNDALTAAPAPTSAMQSLWKKVLALRNWLRGARSDFDAGNFVTPGLTGNDKTTLRGGPSPSDGSYASMATSVSAHETASRPDSATSTLLTPASSKGNIPDIPCDFQELCRFFIGRCVYLLHLTPAAAYIETTCDIVSKHCYNYVVNGTFASPVVLHEVKRIRSLRARSRTLGLQLLSALVSACKADPRIGDGIVHALGECYRVRSDADASCTSMPMSPIMALPDDLKAADIPTRLFKSTDPRWLMQSSSTRSACCGADLQAEEALHAMQAKLQSDVAALRDAHCVAMRSIDDLVRTDCMVTDMTAASVLLLSLAHEHISTAGSLQAPRTQNAIALKLPALENSYTCLLEALTTEGTTHMRRNSLWSACESLLIAQECAAPHLPFSSATSFRRVKVYTALLRCAPVHVKRLCARLLVADIGRNAISVERLDAVLPPPYNDIFHLLLYFVYLSFVDTSQLPHALASIGISVSGPLDYDADAVNCLHHIGVTALRKLYSLVGSDAPWNAFVSCCLEKAMATCPLGFEDQASVRAAVLAVVAGLRLFPSAGSLICVDALPAVSKMDGIHPSDASSRLSRITASSRVHTGDTILINRRDASCFSVIFCADLQPVNVLHVDWANVDGRNVHILAAKPLVSRISVLQECQANFCARVNVLFVPPLRSSIWQTIADNCFDVTLGTTAAQSAVHMYSCDIFCNSLDTPWVREALLSTQIYRACSTALQCISSTGLNSVHLLPKLWSDVLYWATTCTRVNIFASSKEHVSKDTSIEMQHMRRETAEKLSELGYTVELCVKALELHADDADRALAWLLSPESEAFVRGGGLAAEPEGTTPQSRAARYLATTMGLPRLLCERVLELTADDRNAAMAWLLDFSHLYASQPEFAASNAGPLLLSAPTRQNSNFLDGVPVTTSLKYEMQNEGSRQEALPDSPHTDQHNVPVAAYRSAILESLVERQHEPLHVGDLVLLPQDVKAAEGVVIQIFPNVIELQYKLADSGVVAQTSLHKSKLRRVKAIRSAVEAHQLLQLLQDCSRAYTIVSTRLLLMELIASGFLSWHHVRSIGGTNDIRVCLPKLLLSSCRFSAASEGYGTLPEPQLQYCHSHVNELCRAAIGALMTTGAVDPQSVAFTKQLADECEWNLLQTTAPGDGSKAQVLESLHPHPHHVTYTGKMQFKGARALQIQFDTLCSVAPDARLCVAKSTEALAEGKYLDNATTKPWAPIVLLGDTVCYRFTSEHSVPHFVDGKAQLGAWGFRMYVSPLHGLSWMTEAEVLVDPSLEWATWLLEFLLLDTCTPLLRSPTSAPPVSLPANLIPALINYLQSPGMPFKNDVVELLCRLLMNSHRLADAEPHHFAPFDQLERALVDRWDSDRIRGAVFLPSELQRMFELCAIARSVNREGAIIPRKKFDPVADVKTSSFLMFKTVTLREPVKKIPTVPLERKPIFEILVEVFDLAASLAATSRIPDWAACAAVMKAYGKLDDKRLVECLVANAAWSKVADEELVRHAAQLTVSKSGSLLKLSPSEVTSVGADESSFPTLATYSSDSVLHRFSVLQVLNERLAACIELVNLTESLETAVFAKELHSIGHIIFADTKTKIVEDAIETTWEAGTSNISCTLYNTLAFQSLDAQIVDAAISNCIFAQMFRQIAHKPVKIFRCKLDDKQRIMNVRFWGEEGLDWGGISRDAITRAVEDCFSNHIDLFIPCAGSDKNGGERDAADKFVPNPKYARASPRIMAMYEFVGRLMGHSMRHKQYFPFLLPTGVWNMLVRDRMELDDLASIDQASYARIKSLQGGIFPSGTQYFVISGADRAEVGLIPNGAAIVVTRDNIAEYVSVASEYKLHEFDKQVEAMKRGLFSVVPRRAVHVCSAAELEQFVCGDPVIDVDVLKSHTEYHGYSKYDRVIKTFWDVLRSLSNEERAKFIRFACGRGRLPRGDSWDRPFKLSRKAGGDDQLPLSHSCFFHIELPGYSCPAVMRQRILAAINFGLDAYLIA